MASPTEQPVSSVGVLRGRRAWQAAALMGWPIVALLALHLVGAALGKKTADRYLDVAIVLWAVLLINTIVSSSIIARWGARAIAERDRAALEKRQAAWPAELPPLPPTALRRPSRHESIWAASPLAAVFRVIAIVMIVVPAAILIVLGLLAAALAVIVIGMCKSMG